MRNARAGNPCYPPKYPKKIQRSKVQRSKIQRSTVNINGTTKKKKTAAAVLLLLVSYGSCRFSGGVGLPASAASGLPFFPPFSLFPLFPPSVQVPSVLDMRRRAFVREIQRIIMSVRARGRAYLIPKLRSASIYIQRVRVHVLMICRYMIRAGQTEPDD